MKNFKLSTEHKSLWSLFDQYKNAFDDYEKHLKKIDEYEQKLIAKSIEKINGVRIVKANSLHPTAYLPEELWSDSEVKEWEELTGFSFTRQKDYFCENPDDQWLINERNITTNAMSIYSEDRLEWISIILDIVENMLEWALNNRKIKNFMSNYNTFIK